ncbi:Peptidase C45 acyl-coenzyme A:6-aminopenicillanic acid acyl-transferase [Penicillium chermesinum]|uniref:Peptidase C45 acyl-coenzyme A:6-aminopenicillanic acid acyl-transferase n=1 Tax=Penicillium chermesinum TaxID=63820 RepID=A0A9W9NGF4_9EURO|nr:Peptidase C45 acyl-coenzyme A:6-aminopenicillanic acid acyl-transferase [Penicillium chermesinum]KAJ5219525.1 Peptidase C45 acyl-coenzyme A:6-aminopenicillanic acid acyl-transferase [Penicillium chermesinum]KAJ6153545.1 Peptidase C45 acyl-coenzyme A:6-aminopenicillanic acid acyl-transferase [Penicillium chermesinum]
MIEISCSGSPYEIGFQHGSQAKALVHGSILFYREYFQRNSNMDWETAEEHAIKYQPFLEKHVPHLVEEMKGISIPATIQSLSSFKRRLRQYALNLLTINSQELRSELVSLFRPF